MELRKYIREMVETELSELARISTNIKIGDTAKAEAAKKLLSGTWLEDMIDVVMAAGEVGIPQPDLARKLGKTSQQAINPKVNSFLDSGVFTKGELSTPKKEKSTSNSGMLGRPTSEKVLMAKELNSKFEADSDYEPNKEELETLGSEFIEKLRMRVMGTLKRGRKLGASTAKDGMTAAMKNVMNANDEDGDGDVDDEDLDLVSENIDSKEVEEFLNSMINMSIPEDAEEGEKIQDVWNSEDADELEFKKAHDYIKSKGGTITIKGNPDVIYTALENGDIEYKLTVTLSESLNESFTRMQKIAGLIK